MVTIRFLKDTEKFKVGEEAETSKKSAENAIEQGFAEYVEEDSRKKGIKEIVGIKGIEKKQGKEKKEGKMENKVIDKEINFYSKCNRPEENEIITVGKFIDYVRSEMFKDHCDYLRSEKDKDKRQLYKFNNLPAVTIAGTFSYRAKEKLTRASGLASVDIDIYDSDLSDLKDNLKKDEYLYAMMESPSGGLKLIVRIPICKNAEEYDNVYSQILDHYNKYNPKNDKSTRDISRLVYLTYDPELYINEEAKEYPAKIDIKLEDKETIEKIEESQPNDKSRSATEYWEVVKQIKKGKTKGQVFSEMNKFAKWVTAHPEYKELTYKKALDYVTDNQVSKEKKKEEEEKTISKSFFEFDGSIYEQVKGRRFVYLKDGQFHYSASIKIDDKIVMPCDGEEITREVVLLPEAPEEYGDIITLVKEIKEFIHEWLDIPEQYEVFASWYVLLTYVYDRINTINYLRIMGDTGTGKSRFLDTIGRLCYKATTGSGGVTVAAVKRIIDKWKGTLLVDEADFKESDEKNELVKLFNLGFERNRTMFNCDKNDPSTLEFFDPFCPKVMATRRQFDDQALEARCLTTVAYQTNRKDIVSNLPAAFSKKQLELRNKLLKFRFDYYYKIDMDSALNLDLGHIEPRIRQAVNGFIPLISNDKEAFDMFKAFINNYNKEIIEERGNSFDGQLITTIAIILKEGQTIITPKDVAVRLEESGLKATDRTVGKHLKQLGIKNEVKKVDGKTKRVIIIDKKATDIFKRYISDEELLGYVGYDCYNNIVDPHKNETDEQKNGNEKNPLCTNSNVTNVTDVTFLSKFEEKDKLVAKNMVQPSFPMEIKKQDKFDEESLVFFEFEEYEGDHEWVHCTIQGCDQSPCKRDKDNVPYCKVHWGCANQ